MFLELVHTYNLTKKSTRDDAMLEMDTINYPSLKKIQKERILRLHSSGRLDCVIEEIGYQIVSPDRIPGFHLNRPANT